MSGRVGLVLSSVKLASAVIAGRMVISPIDPIGSLSEDVDDGMLLTLPVAIGVGFPTPTVESWTQHVQPTQ